MLTPPTHPATKADVLNAITRMGTLQIDTISVVARSHQFVLFSRLEDYDTKWLDELLVEKMIFEQWARAASFIPMEDYPLFRRLTMEGHRSSYFGKWAEENRSTVDRVLNVIRSEGPRRSADFESEKSPGGWWNWKIEKAALEFWFARGDLMVSQRKGFQRVYDLRERVLPDWQDASAPPLPEVHKALVLRSVHCMGFARRDWVWNYYGLKKKLALEVIDRLLEEGALHFANVDGWNEPVIYAASDEPLLRQAEVGSLSASYTTLLSPFDPIVWDRDRAHQLFDFHFRIQAYTPADKRQYGYFPLPILHNGMLVGRLDAKAHRKKGIFEVKSLFLEDRVKPDEMLLSSIAEAINQCAHWHRTPQVILQEGVPQDIKHLLKE
jgi:uncharacterized protein YcaQ